MLKKVLCFFQRGIPKFYQYVVLGLFFLILFYLAFLSLISTSGVYSSEVTYFVQDSIILNLAAFLVVLLLACAIKIFRPTAHWLQCIQTDSQLFFRYRRILLAILAAVAVIWVLAIQCQPGADQLAVQNAVYGLNTGDYSSFTDGYIAMRHHQLSFTWISYLFSVVFGSYNSVAFQVFNVVGLVLFCREFSEVCILSGLSRKISLATVFTGILFYPLIMYCSFVYGNIWGLALSLLAIRFALQFLQQHRCRYAVLAALVILAGICFKFNYIIFLIGILLYAVVETIRQKKVKLLLLPVLLILSILIQSMLPVALARQVTGDSMDRGASTWAWAAMGLQREGPFCPGWYNNYDVYSYWDSEENPQVQSELAKQNLADSIGFFTSHPGEALRFFTVKTASQWNNPTFQCYWITQNSSTSFQQSSWVSWFTSENGMALGRSYLNLLQFVILAGSLLYCVLYWKDPKKLAFLMLAMIFVGGFLFHIVWEAKAQYTLSYFVLLIPYAIAGYSKMSGQIILFCKRAHQGKIQIKAKQFWKSKIPLIVLTVAMIVLLSVCYSGGRLSYLSGDTANYAQQTEISQSA